MLNWFRSTLLSKLTTMNNLHRALVFLALFAMTSCSNTPQEPSDGERAYWENGNVKSELHYENGQLDGECVWYYANGKKMTEATYANGEINGEMRKWFENGQLFQEGSYVDGLMDGLWFVYYPSGALAAKADYKMGTGKQICYEESGYKCLEVPYRNNLKHGREMYYNPDGRLTKVVEYEDGKVISEDNNPQNQE